MAELMSHGQHEFIRIVLGFFEVDRHLEKRACVVERIYECQRGAAGFIVGLEPAKETEVSELVWGCDRCEGLPRTDEGGARLAETQRAKVAVDDNMGNGKKHCVVGSKSFVGTIDVESVQREVHLASGQLNGDSTTLVQPDCGLRNICVGNGRVEAIVAVVEGSVIATRGGCEKVAFADAACCRQQHARSKQNKGSERIFRLCNHRRRG